MWNRNHWHSFNVWICNRVTSDSENFFLLGLAFVKDVEIGPPASILVWEAA